MSADALKPKLTFAKVAASANAKPIPNARSPAPIVPVPPTTSATNSTEMARLQDAPDIAIPAEVDKCTPRPAKSTPVQMDRLEGVIIDRGAERLAVPSNKPGAVPVSEENVTRLALTRAPVSNVSFDGKSTTSGTTFPLDEKESLRPDDSASVNAQEDDDAPGSTQPSSQVGSDTGARAFSEQLREISTMGPPSSRQQLNIARAPSSGAPTPGILFQPTPVPLTSDFHAIAPNLGGSPAGVPFAPDEKLLEALNSVRDRVWVLKLEQDITDFVKDPGAQSFDLPNCNSFYRMLAHKMADYYLLGHTMNESSSGVRLYKTPYCRIPPRLSEVTSPSTAASTPPPSLPQMKILRRVENDTRPSSRDGAVDAESGSDLGKGKFPATREEREARYEAARLRILGSAKPSEEAPAAPPKETDSNSNSVVGRKKTKKQRSDSEDGFEARSAYSMYPQGVLAPAASHDSSNGHPSMAYGMQMPYDASMNGNGVGLSSSNHGEQHWPSYSYPQLSQQGQQWGSDQYGDYDLSLHMQQLSFQQQQQQQQQQQGMGQYSQYASPGQAHAQTLYQRAPPNYSDQYRSSYPLQAYSGPMPYAYAAAPGSTYGKKQNYMQPQFGGYNRGYFNPQSQNFVPAQPSPTFNLPSFQPGLPSPGIPHSNATHNNAQNLQRQTSNQSNGYHSPLTQHHQQLSPQHQRHIQHHPQFTPHAKPQTLTHPLPQPVFSQSQPQDKAQQSAQKDALAQPQQHSTLAKYASPASLPAKPPPPINDSSRIPPHFFAQHAPAGSAETTNRQSPRV